MSSPENQFEFGTRLGIFISVEAALLSAISVSIILCYTGNKLVAKYRARQAIKKLNSTIELPPIDATDSWGFVGLMFAELIHALGGISSIKWVTDGFITEGPLCSAQGHFKQIGDVGVALFSLFIAFDTFFVLTFGWRASRIVGFIALTGLCLFILLMAAISSGVNRGKSPPYYGNTTYWCWISPEYKTQRIVFEYLWMWIAAFVMLILYGMIALVMRGIIVIEADGSVHFKRKTDERIKVEIGATSSDDDDDQKGNKMIANLMLFYPAVYIICVLPISVVRWLDFGGHHIPSAAIITCSAIFSLSGFLNVLLFKFSRPALVSGHNLDPPSEPDLSAMAPVLHSHSSSEGTRKKRVGGLGLLPDDMDTPAPTSPVSPIIGPETSAARYARAATANMNERLASDRKASNSTRPGTQESSRSGKRDSAPPLRPATSEGSGSARAGLGRLPE